MGTKIALVVAALAGLQGCLLLLDEIYFHRPRGLGDWERLGHPIDTLGFSLPLALSVFAAPSAFWLGAYALLSLISCLCITKDEWIHQTACKPMEHWLHAALFELHPIVLLGVGWLWMHALGEPLRLGLFLCTPVWATYQWWYWRDRGAVRIAINNTFYGSLGERWYEDDAHPIALLRAESKRKLAYVRSCFATWDLPRQSRILDIGCGAGLITNPLAEDRYEMVGVDLSAGALETARAHVPPAAQAHYRAADAYSLPFSDASFDVVLMLDFLEHVEDPQRALKEAARVLRPGGKLVFHTFNRTWLSNLLAVHALQLLQGKGEPHVHVSRLFIKPEELRRMGAKTGMEAREFFGIRPRVWHRSFFWSLLHRRVHPEFDFVLSSSLQVGYLGYMAKICHSA